MEEERSAEFQLLSSYFKNTLEISEEEYLKIFKAIYYNYWLCDGKKVEQVSDQLSSLLSYSREPLLFVKYFLKTLDREWDSIDFLRLDKFYLLIRKIFKEICKWKDFTSLGDLLLEILLSEKSKRGLKLFLVQILAEEILVFKYSAPLLRIYAKLTSTDVYKVDEHLLKIIKSKRISVQNKQKILKISSKNSIKKFEKILDFFKMQNKLKKFKKKKKKTVQWSKDLEKIKFFSKKDRI